MNQANDRAWPYGDKRKGVEQLRQAKQGFEDLFQLFEHYDWDLFTVLNRIHNYDVEITDDRHSRAVMYRHDKEYKPAKHFKPGDYAREREILDLYRKKRRLLPARMTFDFNHSFIRDDKELVRYLEVLSGMLQEAARHGDFDIEEVKGKARKEAEKNPYPYRRNLLEKFLG